MTAALLFAQVEKVATPKLDWAATAPLLILCGAALLLLLISSLTTSRPARGTYAVITVLASAFAIGTAGVLWARVTDAERGAFTTAAGALTVDGFSVFFIVVISLGIALSALLADDYLRRENLDGPELYVLMLLSGAGGIVMAMANDLIVVFLGLETLSIALYVMAGFNRRRAESRESAMKYFVLGAFSSAFLLYGIAFIYGATGSTNLGDIAGFLNANTLEHTGLLLGGFALLLVGFGFKASAVPFHVWTPDVYQGAPTPVTAFMASASKAAAFAALLRVFVSTFAEYRLDWQPLIWGIAVLTLVVGSVLAIVQTDVKRMMAYSSISHAGFILVGVQAATAQGVSAALFYVLSYTFMIVGTFGVATLVSGKGDEHHGLEAYRGLSRRRPGLALTFTVFLLAQAGVPLTSGFLAKFYVIGAAVDAHSYALALIAMLSSVVSAFLYLRIVVAMYMTDEEGAEPGPRVRVPLGAGVALGLAVAFTVVVGILPQQVVHWADRAIPVVLASGR
ncbi:MAG: proton-translocating NADH-quinone oxidoreductase, chain [Acidimicrobiales bacterium]|nr:proton-translocating NADH-quinone oxidoreductase, chain [Acidimicrobiales bacterium]